ncbi:hypothetical protein Fmac_001416 [Flemingia macrophylla]|uniref:Uncharacterized protein n=1 Tax=Flemingia macrophylla TaxID=520843 RepID=A0ABD1NHI1_9FABA
MESTDLEIARNGVITRLGPDASLELTSLTKPLVCFANTTPLSGLDLMYSRTPSTKSWIVMLLYTHGCLNGNPILISLGELILTEIPEASLPTYGPEYYYRESALSDEIETPISVRDPNKAQITLELKMKATDSTEAPEVSQEDEITILHVGRQSTHCWIVEAIDFEETIKKIKVKVIRVNNLPKELRIVEDFDDQGQTIGEAQALLAGFLRTLAADCKLFPMDYDRWSGPSGVPKAYFEDRFETILKPRFYFKSNEATAKRYYKMIMGRKWAANRQNLWNEFNDPTKSRDEIIKNMPIGIDKDQWARFVHYRHKPSTLFFNLFLRNFKLKSCPKSRAKFTVHYRGKLSNKRGVFQEKEKKESTIKEKEKKAKKPEKKERSSVYLKDVQRIHSRQRQYSNQREDSNEDYKYKRTSQEQADE